GLRKGEQKSIYWHRQFRLMPEISAQPGGQLPISVFGPDGRGAIPVARSTTSRCLVAFARHRGPPERFSEPPMASSNLGFVQSLAGKGADVPLELDPSHDHQAAVSAALAIVFRGKFCDLILQNRKTTTFSKHSVIYDVGDRERTFFFLQNGFVRVGTMTADGREVIYDVRKAGDVIGELCATEEVRLDRAIALEKTEAIGVPFEEIMEILISKPDLIAILVDVFSRALKEAYAQVNSLAIDDTVRRLVKVLIGLAAKIGRP